ncbi:LOW QUALITY PROTEIN: putative RNA-binding protein ARP1 [Curcuma longa]|uniref:LOW QUALITY PROTEIN: putative RNA-binding protein ARP1 n=1 Tax=Curcuma longa TaxID=136217 RepID=UPI003D9F8599
MGKRFGDTTLTKVFVGGLGWETREEALREHFDRFGDILEAVIIYDKHTCRSTGYGFVTFEEAEAAKHACEDATPVINGRRANCNLASLGAKRAGLRAEPPSTPVPLSAHGPHHKPPPGTADRLVMLSLLCSIIGAAATPNATTAIATVPYAIEPAPSTGRSSQFNHSCHISL